MLSDAKKKAKHVEGLKILSPKQRFQRLPIPLEQVKAGDVTENLLNEIRQITYSLYQAKEIAKKVYNNIMNSIKLWNRLDTIFMISENSKTFVLADYYKVFVFCFRPNRDYYIYCRAVTTYGICCKLILKYCVWPKAKMYALLHPFSNSIQFFKKNQ